MSAPFAKDSRTTFLAPMQDITDAGFISIVSGYGAPDFTIAEYFRIHEFYEFEPDVLKAALDNPERVCVQFIGEDETHIARAVAELRMYPQIKMLDLNLGCPAPKVYKKNVGGGLLRHPGKIRSIMRVMRGEWGGCFSVKMRTGFEEDENFKELLECVLEGRPDFITVHARTVKQLYRGAPDYSKIRQAAKISPVPIIANGDISSADKALKVIEETKCAGVMSGRHAVRNPWIFRQMREKFEGRPVFEPTLADVRGYIEKLHDHAASGKRRMKYVDSRLKKYINFIGASVDEKGEFLYHMRRARGIADLMKVCDAYLVENGNADKKFSPEPYPDVCSRPNHEGGL